MRNIFGVFALSILFTQPMIPQDTIPVSKGWNNIGSLGTGIIPDLLFTEPPGIITTSFYGYAPWAGYQASDTLRKGIGYWIKASGDGIVIFDHAGSADSCGLKRVTYAGYIYHTVRIGSRCWLEENLNVGVLSGAVNNMIDDGTLEKYCWDDDSLYCIKYGGLYQWDEAMRYETASGAQGICPAGWHLPTYAEFQTLSSDVGGDGNSLKAVGEGMVGGAGTNTTGYAALMAGFRSTDRIFNTLGTFFWSSDGLDALNAGLLYLPDYSAEIIPDSLSKKNGFSVRCIEN
jgi:uncharacterized protein (TIGR02145 family)